MYYLYVKTHIKTKLKYLGYTKRDPFKYKGSGIRWLNHINKHDNNVWTNIIFQSEILDNIKEMGLYYSNLWNIVDSDEWANLMVEQGDGGDTSKHIDYNKLDRSKTSARMKKMNASLNNPFKDPIFQKQLQQRMMAKSKPCHICNRIIDPANYSRHILKCEKINQPCKIENASHPVYVPSLHPK